MTIHLTIWWLWWLLIAVYALGVVVGMMLTVMADDVWWYQRPLILIWPAFLAFELLHGLVRFMLGRD